MTDDELKRAIRAIATAQGFDLCRFARPALPEKHRQGLDNWLAQEMQGDMAYMAEATRNERRKHPESIMPGARTVISLAMRHTPPSYTLERALQAKGRGVIAAYAHGDDYHEVMKRRLKSFAAELDELLGRHEQRAFVDTAPVLEHALAEEGGLGWQGRHTLTINREYGSWLMLGELFTTAEIGPDEPAGFHCGTCRACLDICPTGAIVAPFVVDARRCISYLTIEYRGFIDRALRPLMGNHIYGCDDCQIACPWNRHAVAPDRDLLQPRGENVLPPLSELLALDEEGFRNRFRKSPVRRSRRAGLLRNVAIAMGNSGDAAYIPHLIRALGDTEPLVRGHAVWALEQLYPHKRDGEIPAALAYLLQHETDADVLEEIGLTIRNIEDL